MRNLDGLRATTKSISVNQLVDWVNKDKIILPSHEEWTDEAKERLIESLLIRLPIQMIYLQESKNGSLTVIDGQQRIKTICEFIENQFDIYTLFTGYDINGSTFDELPYHLQNRILDTIMDVVIIEWPNEEYIEYIINAIK